MKTKKTSIIKIYKTTLNARLEIQKREIIEGIKGRWIIFVITKKRYIVIRNK